MVDLRNVRFPVQLKPEDAARLVEFLHDIKTAAASLGTSELANEIFDAARRALMLLNSGLAASPREDGSECPWCGRK